MTPSSPPGRAGGLILAALTGVGYLILICPGIYWRDAGELTASAWGLGVAHPTGFPAYLLLAKAAAFIPLGSIAFRINLLSALCGAITVALFYRLSIRICGDDTPATRGAAAAGALLLGWGSTFWLHSTTAEVYVPNLLAVVVFVWLVVHVVETGSARAMRAAAVLTGLCAGLHPSFALVAVVGWLTALIRRRRTLAVDLMWTAALGLAGAAVILYLPIRAAQDPWRNWGDPSSLSGLWDHLTGARIRRSFAARMGGGAAVDTNLATAGIQLLTQLSWSSVLFLIGLPLLLLRRPAVGMLIVGTWAADIVFTVLINPMGMVDLQTGVITTATTIAVLVFGAAGLGRRWIAPEFRRGTATLTFLLAFGLATPAVLSGGTIRDSRRLYHPIELADDPFDFAPPTSLILVSGDDMASATTYSQGVENRRPDCTVLVKQHCTDLAYVDHLRAVHGTDLLSDGFRDSVARGASHREALAVLLGDTADRRPVYWELGDSSLDGMVDGQLRVGVPLSRLFGDPTHDMVGHLTDLRYRWRWISGSHWQPTALQALARRHSILGAWYLRDGRQDLAAATISDARLMFPGDPQVANNYGLLLQRDGVQPNAEREFRTVVWMRPGYALGWYNLGTSLFNRSDRTGAAESFETAAELGAGHDRLVKMGFYMAILEANSGDPDRALLLLDAVQSSATGPLSADIGRMIQTLVRHTEAL